MTGREWVVEAYGCDPMTLRSVASIQGVFRRMVEELSLSCVSAPIWHEFPGEGGITGILLLSESHLACHTFPEHGSLCLNLFCCQERPDWPFRERLAEMLNARDVHIRILSREYMRTPGAVS